MLFTFFMPIFCLYTFSGSLLYRRPVQRRRRRAGVARAQVERDGVLAHRGRVLAREGNREINRG